VRRSCGYSRCGAEPYPFGTDLQPVHERQTDDDEFVTIDMDDEQEHWSRLLLSDETSVPPLLDRSAACYRVGRI
jgi:hypothetical protein